MTRFLKIILISIVYANICVAETIKTNDFKVIENKIQTSAKDTLVIFDVDLKPKKII